MRDSFFDSNVLLYSVSADDFKRERVETLMKAGGLINVQVLNEVANVSRRKFGMSWVETVAFLRTIRSTLEVEPTVVAVHDGGIRVAQRYRLALYDSMLVAAALIAGCDIFWSEDMHDGLVIDGRLTIRNPFVPGAFG